MGDILGGGKKQAEEAARVQKEQIAKQKNIEQAKIAKEEDIEGRRRLLSSRGGRSSLIATGQTGVSGTLGGS